MRLITLLALLALAVSCRSHKEMQTDVSDVSHIDAHLKSSSDSAAIVIDLLHSDFDIDLSGLTISLVPHESLIPDTPAVPVIHINRARLSGSSDAASVKSTEVASEESAELSEESSAEISTESVSSIERPPASGWIAGLIIVAVSIMIGGYLIYRIRDPT